MIQLFTHYEDNRHRQYDFTKESRSYWLVQYVNGRSHIPSVWSSYNANPTIYHNIQNSRIHFGHVLYIVEPSFIQMSNIQTVKYKTRWERNIHTFDIMFVVGHHMCDDAKPLSLQINSVLFTLKYLMQHQFVLMWFSFVWNAVTILEPRNEYITYWRYWWLK